MVTLTLQVLVGILSVLFGILSLRVARDRNAGSTSQRLSWAVVAFAFLFGGISNCLYNVGAVWAFTSGPDSAAWTHYLRWSPAGNYGTASIKVIMAVALIAAAVASLQRVLSRWQVLVGVLLASYVLGSVLGWMRGSHQQGAHYSELATFQMVEVIALLTALFIGLVQGSMDRHLWACAGLYAFRQVLNVLYLSVLAWIGVEGAWTPHPAQVQAYAALVYIAMIGVVIHRIVLARRGIQVPGLLDPVVGSRPSFLG